MIKQVEKSIKLGDSILTLESGGLARQADGAVIAKMGETAVLATVVFSGEPKSDLDFLPLSVHYREKFYSAGKIPGGFIKRERAFSEREVLVSRLIDRSIRPLVAKGVKNEIQVTATTLSYDSKHSPDILAILAASAALKIAEIPLIGTMAAAKIAPVVKNDNVEYILNPNSSFSTEPNYEEIVVSGTNLGIVMVEAGVMEKEEDILITALEKAKDEYQRLIPFIEEFTKEVNAFKEETVSGPYKKVLKLVEKNPEEEALATKLEDQLNEMNLQNDFTNILQTLKTKNERKYAIGKLLSTTYDAVIKNTSEDDIPLLDKMFKKIFSELEKQALRNSIVNDNKRLIGRSPDDIRDFSIKLDPLSIVHGSAVFSRQETQVIVVTTIGTEGDEQIVDGVEQNHREKFMLHYNFPAYSVGEVSNMMAVSRREIGHGKLAYKALRPVFPFTDKNFTNYSVRVVSEVLDSNGSSSMATVCGTSLALMAAGVPIKRPVAGVAMGLIVEGDNTIVLSDIAGEEDHLGDMDFKVAGTTKGINALQMDIKVPAITMETLAKAIKTATKHIHYIISKMDEHISAPRESFSETAPQIDSYFIPSNSISRIIGSEGKNIKAIQNKYNVHMKVLGDDNKLIISASDRDSLTKAFYETSVNSGITENHLREGKEYSVEVVGDFYEDTDNGDIFIEVNYGSKQGKISLSNNKILTPKNLLASAVLQKGLILSVKYEGREDSEFIFSLTGKSAEYLEKKVAPFAK